MSSAALALLACGSSSGGAPDLHPEAALGVDGRWEASPGREAGRTDTSAPTGPGHPFGSHTGYTTAGVIAPSHHSPAELDAATANLYAQWKSRYLKQGCDADQMYVKSSPSTDEWTVSEGHGYGMLVAVVMAGHDPEARSVFDALYRYYDRHRSTVNADLMAWAQDASCKNASGADSATDSDLDVAYALLLAAAQWRTAGSIDYGAEATRIIAAILKSDVHPQNSILIGDWASDPSDSHYTGTRPSDFAVGHFKAFSKATGVARWSQVVAKTYEVIAYLQAHYAAATGLLPDFAINATGATPAPAPANWLEGDDDGRFAWNACRTPWRLATDYLMSGETRAQAAVRKMNAWVRAKTADDPSRIVDGYRLDGTALGTENEMAFVAPFAVAAMVEPSSGSNQSWLNALWDRMASAPATDYYGDSLRLLAMIVVSRNWWTP